MLVHTQGIFLSKMHVGNKLNFSVPSQIFAGSNSCVAEFNENLRPYFEPDYECEDPYGEWTEWSTFDAQTEARIRIVRYYDILLVFLDTLRRRVSNKQLICTF